MSVSYNPLEIFNQLESGNQDEYESAKQKLNEAFNSSKLKNIEFSHNETIKN